MRSSSLFSVEVVEPDFNESIAATAASSSDTNGSSIFSSERTLTSVVCSLGGGGGGGGGVRLGVTTIDDFSEGGEDDPLDMLCWASSSGF